MCERMYQADVCDPRRVLATHGIQPIWYDIQSIPYTPSTPRHARTHAHTHARTHARTHTHERTEGACTLYFRTTAESFAEMVAFAKKMIDKTGFGITSCVGQDGSFNGHGEYVLTMGAW